MKTSKDLLFENISDSDTEKLLNCMKVRPKTFAPGEIIYSFTDSRDMIGIITEGESILERLDIDGNRTLLERLAPGDIFGAVIAFGNDRSDCFRVICVRNATVLFLPYRQMLTPCSKLCACHQRLTHNLFRIFSNKLYSFSERIEVLSNRSIRGKLLYYLNMQASKNHSKVFTLPFSQTVLADYLCVDRSAMAREIKNMREDGLCEIKGRRVTLP